MERDIERNIPADDLARPADSVTQSGIIGWMSEITGRAEARGRTGERPADYVKTYVNAAYEFVRTASGTKWAKKAKLFAHLVRNPAQRIKKFKPRSGLGSAYCRLRKWCDYGRQPVSKRCHRIWPCTSNWHLHWVVSG